MKASHDSGLVSRRLVGGANTHLGQHFLVDEEVLEKIVDASDVRTGDRVLEIGPGLGVLTDALMKRGARVRVIERDRRFIPLLQKRFAKELSSGQLTMLLGDALHVEWFSKDDRAPWKFISNLPYQITSAALRVALWRDCPPSLIVTLIQREVAERIVAADQKHSLLSLMVALASSSSEIVCRVGREAFDPPPKVESAVLKVVPLSEKDRLTRWGMDPERIMAVAKKGFTHPRKFLASNLAVDVTRVGLSAQVRAEDVSLEKWVELARPAE